MDLKTYATKHNGTAKRWCPVLAEVAQRVGCAADTLYMIAAGHKRPSAVLARAIDEATAGEVTRYDLRPDVFGKAPAKSRKRAA